ncbi:MAG: DUF1566 domain-containing protein [Nitrospinaceae bacterium]
MNEKLPQIQEQDTKPKRFVEKGPHVIFDNQTRIFWLKKDSWQDKGKFFNWHEARDYADNKNMRKIGGFNDWRLPTFNDAVTLYDENLENTAKGGAAIHIDPLFPEGAFKFSWLMGDTSTRRPRFEFMDGTTTTADEYSFGAVRLCRKDPVKRDHTRPPVRR